MTLTPGARRLPITAACWSLAPRSSVQEYKISTDDGTVVDSSEAAGELARFVMGGCVCCVWCAAIEGVHTFS